MDRSGLTQQAYDKLREAIVSGELRPSQLVVESTVAKGLGMSRTPVREALYRLEANSYVTKVSNGRLIVADHTPKQIQSCYEIRQALEGMAIKLSCERGNGEQMVTIEELAGQMVEAIQDRAIDKIAELDNTFHNALYTGCGNQKLLELVMTFKDQHFIRRIIRTYTAKDWRICTREHRAIVESFRQRNVTRTGKLLQRHLITTMQNALERL